MTSELALRSAAEVEPKILAAFLRRFFPPGKATFLMRHGTWWHRGDENRWVLCSDDGGQIAGYCGVIPTRCVLGKRIFRALWWVDLVIAPEFRGRGLQTRFDELLRQRGELLLGFPNALAAKIHRHHGWGVREDLRSLLMPLRPSQLGFVRRAGGVRGKFLQLFATASAPWAALWRARLRGRRSARVRRLDRPDFEELATVAAEHRDPRLLTTLRDADQLRWRYGEAPRPMVCYAAGDGARPRLVLVARRVRSGGSLHERWLDLFGALDDSALLDDLTRYAAGRAVEAGVAQITVLAAERALARRLRRRGFLLSARSRFCWLSDDRDTMSSIASSGHHWCLGDSDNDDPESPTGEPEP